MLPAASPTSAQATPMEALPLIPTSLLRLAAALAFAVTCAAAAAQTADTNCFDTPALAVPVKQFAKYIGYDQVKDSITFWMRQDICYADKARWYDKSAGTTLRQRATLYSPVDPAAEPDGTRHPVVIYSHPNGADEKFKYTTGSLVNAYDTSRLFQSVLVQALKAGYVVVSVEFRHPIASFDPAADPQPGNTDLRDAVQYLRFNAAAWHIDPANMFLVGQSRGSLNMLWAIKDDDATQEARPWRQASSKVNAVWDYQAQTCYDRVPSETTFLKTKAYADFETDKRFRDFPAGYAAGCSMNEVAVANQLPPLVLMYDEAPRSKTDVTLQTWCKLDWQPQDPEGYCWNTLGWHDDKRFWNTWLDEHDANFGVALVKAFGDAAASERIKACYGVAVMYDDASGPWNGYRGFPDFFDQNQVPPVQRTYPSFACPKVDHLPYTPPPPQ
jgi:hypothetical protein